MKKYVYTWVIMFPVLASGCATKVQTYVKPEHDFSRYTTIAIASFAADPKYPETAKGAAELPMFFHAIMSAKGYDVIDVQRSVEEVKKLATADKELSPETLAAMGEALKVNGVIRGLVKYYGVVPEAEQSRLGTTSRSGMATSSPSMRRLGFRSHQQSLVRPQFTAEEDERIKEYKVTVRLELFDVPSKSIVWWGEATTTGETDDLKAYAKQVFDALLKRFPVPPRSVK